MHFNGLRISKILFIISKINHNTKHEKNTLTWLCKKFVTQWMVQIFFQLSALPTISHTYNSRVRHINKKLQSFSVIQHDFYLWKLQHHFRSQLIEWCSQRRISCLALKRLLLKKSRIRRSDYKRCGCSLYSVQIN